MKITVFVKDSSEAYGLKMEIDRHGLRPDHGYTWKFNPAVIEFYGEVAIPAQVEFDFDDPKWATYFQLKWGV